MVNEGELKNRRILIKNAEDGTTIADTVILRFNSEANSVMIRADSLPEKRFYNIYAIIFAARSLYEFGGSIRVPWWRMKSRFFLGKARRRRAVPGFATRSHLQGT